MATDVGAVTYTTFGKQGTGDDDFDLPLGMAFNHDKTEIFVADSNNNRVQVLSYDREKGELKFKETFNHSGHNLNHPSGVAVYNNKKNKNIIIVADSDNNHICGLNTSIKTQYNVNTPCSVALDVCANIFAYDSSNCRIAIFTDSSTTYICEKGSDNGQLGGRGTLAFDNNGNLVVADTENNRVQVLNSSDGAHIRTITGIINDMRGKQLNRPGGIAFTDDGKHIIIADTGNHRVHVLTYTDGKIVKSFGMKGEFNGPYGVLVDDEYGRIIVSDEKTHRIQVIDNALTPKKLAKVEVKPLGPGKSKYPNLENAIRDAIKAFSTSLGSDDHDHEYADILNELNKKIDEDRKRIMIELDAPDAKSSNDTDSELKNKTGVRASGHRSLCNIGNMCYMNAALQLIYSMSDFRTAISTMEPPTLTNYLTAMDKGVNCKQAESLAKSLYDLAKKNNFATTRSFNKQEDASELITTVLSDNIFDTFKKSMAFTSAAALIYDGSNPISDECKSINEGSKQMVLPESDLARLISLYAETTGTVLMASVVVDNDRKLKTFKEVFDEHLKTTTDIEENVDDSADAGKNLSDKNGIINNLPACMMSVKTDAAGTIISKVLNPVCNPLIGVEPSGSKFKPFKLKNIKNKTYISPGLDQKYFIVILQRSSTSSDGKSPTKLKHSVDLTNAQIEIRGSSFIIKGCICHHGDNSTSGHYTYVEFENGNPKTVYDDHNIVDYATYNTNIPNRTVDITGYVLLFEDMTKK